MVTAILSEIGIANRIRSIAVNQRYQKKNLGKKALRCYREALERSPHNWKIFWNLSVLHEERGDLEKAVEAAKEVIGLRPDMKQAAERLRTLEQRKGHPGSER